MSVCPVQGEQKIDKKTGGGEDKKRRVENETDDSTLLSIVMVLYLETINSSLDIIHSVTHLLVFLSSSLPVCDDRSNYDHPLHTNHTGVSS